MIAYSLFPNGNVRINSTLQIIYLKSWSIDCFEVTSMTVELGLSLNHADHLFNNRPAHVLAFHRRALTLSHLHTYIILPAYLHRCYVMVIIIVMIRCDILCWIGSLTLCPSLGHMWLNMEQWKSNTDKLKSKNSEKTCPRAALSTTNPTWTDTAVTKAFALSSRWQGAHQRDNCIDSSGQHHVRVLTHLTMFV
jgi:hypothetical protein